MVLFLTFAFQWVVVFEGKGIFWLEKGGAARASAFSVSELLFFFPCISTGVLSRYFVIYGDGVRGIKEMMMDTNLLSLRGGRGMGKGRGWRRGVGAGRGTGWLRRD